MPLSDVVGPVRRVVTEESAEGRSRVWLDGEPANVKTPTDEIRSVLIWATQGSPAAFTGDDDPGEWVLGTAPPAEGSRVVHFTLAPGEKRTAPHRNDTLDYIVAVSGETTIYLDDNTVVLQPGDVFVQRGTNHAIGNHGAVPAVTVTVLLDGTPKREGSLSSTDQAR